MEYVGKKETFYVNKESLAVDSRINLEWQVVRQLLKFWEPHVGEYDILLARWDSN